MESGSSTSSVVTGIGRVSASRKPRVCVTVLPVAPVFFLAALLLGVVASVYQGGHLWLMSQGRMPVAENYLELRKAHAEVQLLGFFGGFVTGFLLHAAPRLFEVERIRPLFAIGVLPIFVLAGISQLVFPEVAGGGWLFSLHYMVLLSAVVYFAHKAPRHLLSRGPKALLWGVAWLVIATFLDLSAPALALLVFWAAFVPIIFTAIDRIFFALLGVPQGVLVNSHALRITYLASVVALVAYSIWGTEHPELWTLVAFGVALCAAQYLHLTFSWRALSEARKTPMALAFWIGMGWFIIGTALLFGADIHADAVLHIWVTGLALPLILTVSAQILSALSGEELCSRRTLNVMVLLWQVVPLGRGVGRVVHLPALMASVVSVASAIVLIWWLALVLKRNSTIIGNLCAQAPSHRSLPAESCSTFL